MFERFDRFQRSKTGIFKPFKTLKCFKRFDLNTAVFERFQFGRSGNRTSLVVTTFQTIAVLNQNPERCERCRKFCQKLSKNSNLSKISGPGEILPACVS